MILWFDTPVVFPPQKEGLSSTSRKESLFPFEVKLLLFKENFCILKVMFGGVILFVFASCINSVGKRRFLTQESLWPIFARMLMVESL